MKLNVKSISLAVCALASALLLFEPIRENACAAISGPLVSGCATGGSYSKGPGGFDESEFNTSSMNLDSSGSFSLLTGKSAIDVNNIVIPTRQNLNLYFIHDGAGYIGSLGWFLLGFAERCLKGVDPSFTLPDATSGGVNFRQLYEAHQWCLAEPSIEQPLIRWAFPYVNDSDSNGILQSSYSREGWSYSSSTGKVTFIPKSLNQATDEFRYEVLAGMSVDHNGILDLRDTRYQFPTLEAGEEVVFFYLTNGWSDPIFYSKNHWTPTGSSRYSPSDYATCRADDDQSYNCAIRDLVRDVEKCHQLQSGQTEFPLNPSRSIWLGFDLDLGPTESANTMGVHRCDTINWRYNDARLWTPGDTTHIPSFTRGLVTPSTRANLLNFFGLTFTGKTDARLYTQYEPFNHFIAVAPPADRFRWLLSIEDLASGGDSDFNDIVFLIERQTGGFVSLKPENALSPSDPQAYIMTANVKVKDRMPCAGKTRIDYELSPNGGVDWIAVTKNDWNQVKDSSGASVQAWEYGSPEYTERSASLNFINSGLIGRDLLWRATFISQNDFCAPSLEDIQIDFVAAKNARFSRSSPTVLGNVVYSSAFETPAVNWSEISARGHFYSNTLYDPEKARQNVASGGDLNWDAGEKLTNDGPGPRTIYTPKVILRSRKEDLRRVRGVRSEFFDIKLRYPPIASGSLVVTDGVETFREYRSNQLIGSLGGYGEFDRYKGIIKRIKFNTAPKRRAVISATYQEYQTSSIMRLIIDKQLNNDAFGIDKSSTVSSKGRSYTYDLNKDGRITQDDAKWLRYRTRGFANGYLNSSKREWLLDAIDHSTPALVGAPAIHSWYYGSQIDTATRETFEHFICRERKRPTRAYIGSRSGMIHSFNAGAFRPYYVDESALPTTGDKCANIARFRAALNPFVELDPTSGEKIPIYKPEPNVTIPISRGFYEWVGARPDYGDGKETWSVIPNDIIPRLKNGIINQGDPPFVDASPSVAYVRFSDGSWRAVLISAEGEGGDTVMALDITDPDNPEFLWEYASPDLFKSRSSPAIGMVGRITGVGAARWGVFFVTGVNNDPTAYPTVYALDLETGALISRLEFDSDTIGLGGLPSGQPALLDSDGNGFIDKLFIGSDKGLLYKALIPDDPFTARSIKICPTPFFNAGQPIHASPTVAIRQRLVNGKMVDTPIVLFGTADSPYQDDSVDLSTIRYKFFSVGDLPDKTSCEPGVELWSKTLPKGHRIFASAAAAANKIYFGSSTSETEDPCAPSQADSSASGSIFVLDIVHGDDPTRGSEEIIENSGNIVSSPIVEDRRLFVSTDKRSLKVYGDGVYQNDEVEEGDKANPAFRRWREITAK